jgi:FAD-dependent urate hydroxylase
MGITGHQLSGLPAGVDRLVWHLTRDVFVENDDQVLADFFAYDVPELTNLGPQPEGTPPRQTSPRTPDR